MRELSSVEVSHVAGADSLPWELIKLFGGELLIEGVKWVYSKAGVAGPGGNENDNGGTSYGIDIYNTFGRGFGINAGSGGHDGILWAGGNAGEEEEEDTGTAFA